MTDNVIQETQADEPPIIELNKCACGCGKTIPDGNKYAAGHFAKHRKQIKQAEQQPEPPQSIQEPPDISERAPLPLNVTAYIHIHADKERDVLAWYETEDHQMLSEIPAGVGIVQGIPYYLIPTPDGMLVPPQLLPGFRGMFTKKAMYEIINSNENAAPNAPDEPIISEIKQDEVPAEPTRVILPPIATKQESNEHAPEPKKKSASFLSTIFGKKEEKKKEGDEISEMLRKIQNNAGKTTG